MATPLQRQTLPSAVLKLCGVGQADDVPEHHRVKDAKTRAHPYEGERRLEEENEPPENSARARNNGDKLEEKDHTVRPSDAPLNYDQKRNEGDLMPPTNTKRVKDNSLLCWVWLSFLVLVFSCVLGGLWFYIEQLPPEISAQIQNLRADYDLGYPPLIHNPDLSSLDAMMADICGHHRRIIKGTPSTCISSDATMEQKQDHWRFENFCGSIGSENESILIRNDLDALLSIYQHHGSQLIAAYNHAIEAIDTLTTKMSKTCSYPIGKCVRELQESTERSLDRTSRKLAADLAGDLNSLVRSCKATLGALYVFTNETVQVEQVFAHELIDDISWWNFAMSWIGKRAALDLEGRRKVRGIAEDAFLDMVKGTAFQVTDRFGTLCGTVELALDQIQHIKGPQMSSKRYRLLLRSLDDIIKTVVK